MTETETQAAAAIKAWLTQNPETVSVDDVRGDPGQQQRGIDYLWQTSQAVYTITVTADRWEQAGQFFFETDSSAEVEATGRFLTTQADYIFYYFVNNRSLYILPMPDTRDWFLLTRRSYPERPAMDSANPSAIGSVVPIREVLAAVPGIEEAQL